MVDLLWEAPLGLCSFLFYRLNRAVLRSLYDRHLERHPERNHLWRPLSAQMLTQPGALPCLMTTGPRWNPHAIISATGPLAVQSSLAVDLCCANASAGEWTLVLHTFPGHVLVGSLGHNQRDAEIKLAPGRYVLFLRYYHCKPQPRLPAISVDGQAAVPEHVLTSETNSFYETLARRSNWYYRCLHAYIYPMLKFQRSLPGKWIANEFLPVGNPETSFNFGHLARGERLEISCDQLCADSSHVYLTLYNRSSFPTFWCELDGSRATLPPAAVNGFYLVRQHVRNGIAAPAGSLQVRRLAPGRPA
jgi:hypothetical protein